MKINGQSIDSDKFAYDNCHKIYIIEDEADLNEARDIGYNIYPIKALPDAYKNSCELKFISNWKLDKQYVAQFEDCIFE